MVETCARYHCDCRDTSDREDQGIRSAAIPDPGRKYYYSHWHFAKLVTTVFLGNKKTHQSTIDATAVLLHRHDQVQPARRPSLVALLISGPWIWQRCRQKTPCLATFWAKLVRIGVFSKGTDSPDFIIPDIGRSHGNADRNWNKSLSVTQPSPWAV